MIPGIHDYGLFVVTCILINVTPPQDTFYILRLAASERRSTG